MNFNISLNPYYLYSISLSLILILYSLGWSKLYPKISSITLCFLSISIIISCILGYIYDNKFSIESKSNENPLNIKKITIAILFANIIEFIYEGAIPFVEITILKSNYVYLEYSGIPTFHVILFTFNAFFAIYIFHRILIENKKLYTLYFLLNLLPSILTYNRGMLMMIAISCISVFVLEKWKGILNIKNIIIVSIFSLIFIYCFGIVGNIRSNSTYNRGNGATNSDYIMMVGEADEDFRKSLIPKPMFWGYIYMTSPLANFEANVDYYQERSVNIGNMVKFAKKSVLPDFISKRIETIFPQTYEEVKRVSPNLTVSSFLSDAFVNLGWLGVILIYVYFIFLVLIYRFLLGDDSSFLISGIAILNTVTMLNFFSNMFTFSGLSFQLIYPVILTIIFKKEYFKNLKKRFKNLILFNRRV